MIVRIFYCHPLLGFIERFIRARSKEFPRGGKRRSSRGDGSLESYADVGIEQSVDLAESTPLGRTTEALVPITGSHTSDPPSAI